MVETMVERLFLFVFPVAGAVWGSVCNVLISRLPRREGIAGRCRSCGSAFLPADLVPLYGYLRRRGRCRCCAAAISARYLLVEAAAALLFLLVYCRVGLNLPALLLYLYYVTAALVVFVVDYEHALIPFAVLLPGLPAAVLASVLRLDPAAPTPGGVLLGGAAGGGVFLALYLLSGGRALGLGDVKLALFMGLILGPPRLLLAVLAGSLAGLAYACFMLLFFGRQVRSLGSVSMGMHEGDPSRDIPRFRGMMMVNGRPAVPFGSFLSLGFLLSLFWGRAAAAFLWGI